MADECSNCRFWDDHGPAIDRHVGSCRRYPPFWPNKLINGFIDHWQESNWPTTDPSSWCGEHAPAQPENG